MSERAIRLFVPGFLLIYFLVGFSRWISYLPEIYPFGAWGMFHRVNKIYRDYDLLIHRKGEREFAPPVRASDPDDPLGLELTGHTLLVLNGFYRHARKGQLEEAAAYRDFIGRHVVGPDAEYEIAWILGRSRPSEFDRIKEERRGPFRTAPDASPPDPDARFTFPERASTFRQRPRDESVRPTKSKKSAR